MRNGKGKEMDESGRVVFVASVSFVHDRMPGRSLRRYGRSRTFFPRRIGIVRVAPFVVRESIGKSVFFFGVNCVDFSFKLDILAASRGQSQTSSVSMLFGRAHLARHSAGVEGSSLGALLRKRKVTGRDASLPAPL